MKYFNPIIFADYSDPDVIKDENAFIMTASSFNYIPGLPILISKDLVNWELKNYAIKKLNYEKYNIPCYSHGVWAPSIRKHNNTFYIFFGMPDEGIFEVHTKNHLGDWSEPHLVKKAKGLIDPCPFWDEDKAYIVHAYAKSRIGFKSILGIFEIDKDTNEAIGEDKLLYNGIETNPTIEGPKAYKINDYYYIFAPAGGVATGWQTVLRSKSITGPFEEKIVLAQNNTNINGPHQGALIKDNNNKYWFIHFQDRDIYGRITHLQPVIWENDWPIIGEKGSPVLSYDKADIKENISIEHPSSDNFSNEELSLQWQWSANFQEKFFKIKENKLILNSIYVENGNYKIEKYPNILTQKIIYNSFDVGVDTDFSNLRNKEEAGLAFVDRVNISISLRNTDGTYHLYLNDKFDNKLLCVLEDPKDLTHLSMKLIENNKNLEFSYTIKNKTTTITHPLYEQITSWVGLKIGIYSISNNNNVDMGFAEFMKFKVRKINA